MIRTTGLILLFATLSSCSNGQEKMFANNIRLYENSPAWDLAQAVDSEDTNKIKELSQIDNSLVRFQETQFGQSLLEWAVYTNRYKSAKALVEAGADPNLQSYNGTSAFVHAAEKTETSDYLTLLLKYGGDVNAIAKPTDGKNQYLKTPLISASGSNLESVKILVDAGAEINFYNDKIFRNALDAACKQDRIDIIRYLVIEKSADVSKPLHVRLSGDSLYLHHILRELRFNLDSDSYKVKMEVVEHLKERGMNYWETPIPKHLYEVHPKEYLEKY